MPDVSASIAVRNATRWGLWLAWIVSTPTVAAHEGTERAIAGLTGEIVAQPDRPDLLLRRGHLYVSAGEFGAAASDARRAAETGATDADVAYLRASIDFRAGRLHSARRHLDLAVERAPWHVAARRLRALVSERLDDEPAALADWDRLLLLQTPPDPEAVIRRLRLTEKLAPTDGAAAARAWLESYAASHPPFPALEAEFHRLEAACGAWESLQRRLDRAIAASARPAPLWLKKARYFQQEGRADAAASAARSCLASLHALAPAVSRQPAMLAIEDAASAILNGEPPPPHSPP